MRLKIFGLAVLVCAGLLVPVLGASKLDSVVIEGIPHVRQRPDFCGEACFEMVLSHLGSQLNQDDVFDLSGLDPGLGRGCATKELRQAALKLGFQPGKTWFTVNSRNAAPELQVLFRALHEDLRRGIPSVVCMRYDQSPNTTEHFRLIVGYDQQRDQVLYLEPAEDVSEYRRMARLEFLSLWPLKYRSEAWTVIRLPMEPQQPDLVSKPQFAGFSEADYAQHVRQLKERLPGPGFTIVIEKPFIVVGDEAPDVVRQRARNTVGWAVAQLKSAYFQEDPDKILDVWLFKDKTSYESNARKLFGRTPSTPYGYYSASDGALVMNIATGGGTLVHEIVHPFMESNFPRCPDWFNEGLASLYEQSMERDGKIRGATNWRLAGLQQAISQKRLQSIAELTTRAFYSDDDGTNYAMARYLCYHLQEQGTLREFYRKFRQNAPGDPTGIKTLKGVLGTQDLGSFQRSWEREVMALRFP